ncbi:MAG: DUF3540 domain-containing protein [Desulfovibrio sp.]|jgi:hypothetical protein|nr:DUF3540 domain-containing protein [Desulfovibrio sp.]
MAQTAEFYAAPDARLVTGKVLDAPAYAAAADTRAPALRVLCGNRAYTARTAASCLLQPQKGDTVLLACLEDEMQVVLAVLFRSGDARLRLPAHSTLECPGNLILRCADSLDLQSGRSMRLHAEDLGVTAQNCDLRALSVKSVANSIDICCNTLYSFGKSVLSVFASLTQCLGTSRRMVEGVDETRAGSSTLLAEDTVTVMSKNKLTLAEETARTDAKLIQLG